MSTLTLDLPESLRKGVMEACERDGISFNQFIAIAIAEKLSALLTEKYLQERGQRGNREKYEAALAQVPDVEPEEFDKMPADTQ
jgi:hypothetical protein